MSIQRLISTSPLVVLAAVVLFGCSSSQKAMPHGGYSGLSIQAQITRSDLVFMESVEGSSTTTSILAGVVQVIDGNNIKLFWVLPFFKEKWSVFGSSIELPYGLGVLLSINPFATTADRAYYKALEKTPSADMILPKSMDNESWGIPVLWQTTSVTFHGKAVRFKSDR